jgi:hypothetical protein
MKRLLKIKFKQCKQKNFVVLHLTITAKIGNGNLAILKSKKKKKVGG